MSLPAEKRKEIDQAIADSQVGRALALLKGLWRTEPSLAMAPFIVDRVGKLSDAPPTASCNLLVLRSFTVEPVVPLARAGALCYGMDLSVRVGQFNSYVQEILDPNSTLYQDPTDVVLLAVQTRDLAPELWSKWTDLETKEAGAIIARIIEDYRTWVATIRSRSSAHIVIHNLEKPPLASAGIHDAQCSNGQLAAIEQINAGLATLCGEFTGVHVLDYEQLVARHGRERWHDEHKWLTARLPIAADALIHLANEWLRYLLPIRGKQAKCLVCDLDNTLWGGIIGEDGINGIKLGGEYPGAAYLQLQRAARDLINRGILLAVCSKNNEADALEAIDEHPEMLLSSKDFSALKINWTDKAQNLREIAEELNIGIDSLVLIDDNPVEREFVREMLPEVTVIDIDADAPLGHAAALQSCPLFQRLEVSAEDRKRSQIYAEQQERATLKSSVTSIEDYYRSLEMVASFGLADEASCPRVAQLTQKTNQLNMTTRRYSEQDIQAFMADPQVRVYWTRVEDRFGDNGIVGVMIVRDEGEQWMIDTFLMSCRVIGRTVETAMLGILAEHAEQSGARKLLGPFVPTAKNAPAQEIYANNKFQCIEENDSGSLWELDFSQASLRPPEWIDCRQNKSLGVS